MFKTHTKTGGMIAVILLHLMQPMAAFAAGGSLQAEDTIAGLGTQVRIEGMASQTYDVLTLTPPLGPVTTYDVQTDDRGGATVRIPGEDTEVAGQYELQVASLQTTFEVLPDSMDARSGSMQADRTSLTPDGSDAAEVSVILRDRFSNALAGRPVELVSGRTTDIVQALSGETDASGEQRFLVSAQEPGLMNIRAIDLLTGTAIDARVEIQAGSVMPTTTAMGGYTPTYAQPMQLPYGYMPNYYQMPMMMPSAPWGSPLASNLLGRQLYGQVANPDAVAAFTIRVPTELKVNEDATITITAINAAGQRVEDYTGTVLLSSTDPSAFLPLNGEIPFLPQNLGEKTLTLGLRFRTPSGTQPHALVARDSTNPAVEGTAQITVTGEGGSSERLIEITDPPNRGMVGGGTVTLEGTAPPFLNLKAMGGVDDVQGESDRDGNFAITVTLTPGQRDHTLRITDETGRYDSGNHTLVLDDQPPVVSSITYTPTEPKEGENILIVVESEPGLSSLTLTVGTEVATLEPNASASGSYQALIPAPAAGTYQPLLKGTDSAGNVTEIRSNLAVSMPGLPTVQGVKATMKGTVVELTWSAVEEVEGYRVYVGDSAENFLYTLDTGKPVTTASVAGLRPGTTYFFAVTALQGERESLEKSTPVSMSVLGTILTTKAQDGALMLEWSGIANDMPLSSFLLEYGVEPESYTEQRVLNGELRAYALRDLLNDVTYYLRLTPVTTTGDVLRDAAAVTEGTPTSPTGGFRPAASEPAPFQPGGLGNLHEGAPIVSSTGSPLPAWQLLLLAGMGAIALYAVHRKRQSRMAQSFLMSMERAYRTVR